MFHVAPFIGVPGEGKWLWRFPDHPFRRWHRSRLTPSYGNLTVYPYRAAPRHGSEPPVIAAVASAGKWARRQTVTEVAMSVSGRWTQPHLVGHLSKARSMPEPAQRIKVTEDKDVRIVEFIDNKILDEANIAEIGQALTALVEAKDRPKILLDFAKVDHLSSAALGMLINVNNRIKQQSGQLRLSNIRPQIMEVFEITKLNKLFKILPTRAEALASYN